MSTAYGYWVDLRAAKLSEEGEGSWIQAMPLGKYNHPVYGELDISSERVTQFANNVNSGVRGQDVPIDYDHKVGEASGWVKRAEARPDGLYLFVEWTKKASDLIKQKAYRYFSPEYVNEWTDPRTNKKYQDVLQGGALTNRPFLKGILPINLSELFASDKESKGGNMDFAELKKLLGLPEGATDEQVRARVSGLLAADDKPNPEPAPTPPASSNPQLSELVKQLSEQPQFKQLADMVAEQQKQLAETQAALKLSEVNSRIENMRPDGSRALAPVVKDQLRSIMLEAPKQLSDKVHDLVVALLKPESFVSLGENSVKQSGGTSQSAVVRLNEKVQALMTADNNLDYGRAVEQVVLADPELFDVYRTESYSG